MKRLFPAFFMVCVACADDGSEAPDAPDATASPAQDAAVSPDTMRDAGAGNLDARVGPAVDGDVVVRTDGAVSGPTASVELTRTQHGVLHVRASDFYGAGYGVAYAYTRDNRCLLARRIAEVNGRLAEFLGADAPVRSEVHDLTYTALQSDHYYRGWFDLTAIRAGFDAGAAEVRELAAGYARGAARAFNEPGAVCEVPVPARVSLDDVYRMWVATASVGSGEMLVSFLPHAKPSASAALESPRALPRKLDAIGSNAWAIGREASQGVPAVHLYNPHFPWSGIQRLYVAHVTVPGQLDVMGPLLGGFPLPLAGFNHDVAWGLTFSSAARWTAFELALTAPSTYTLDGAPKSISEQVLEIPVRGEAEPRRVPFYRAEQGPLIDAPAFGLGWSSTAAFAVKDVNATNTRLVEQTLRLGQARSVREVEAQLEAVQGIPWSYTVASDRQGEVFFGDISNLPNVSAADVTRCVTTFTGLLLLSSGYVVLDGSTAACTWNGRLPTADQPRARRTDYLANSNNGYELPNPNQRLQGTTPILGATGAPLGLRASLGLHMIEDRLGGRDGLDGKGFTGALARQAFFQQRNRAAELLVDGIVDDCALIPSGQAGAATVDLQEACSVLASWDRRNAPESRGAALFRGVWMQLQNRASYFATPANLAAPLTTPAGYTPNPLQRANVRNALAAVVVAFRARGIALDASWGSLNRVAVEGASFGVAGGLDAEGAFDVIVSRGGYYTFEGWLDTLAGNAPETLYGASYHHSVELGGADGPRAQGLLAYSQATEKDSPYHHDQLEPWSQRAWYELPFTQTQLAADTSRTSTTLAVER